MTELPTPEEVASSRMFSDIVRSWRVADAGLGRGATSDEQVAWEAQDGERRELARSIVLFRSPNLLCLRDKLDVLIRIASTAGENMDADERLVLEGLCALRADIVHLGG